MQNIWRGLRYLLPYKKLAVGALLSMLITTAANLYIPQLYQQLIDNGIIVKNLNGILIATAGLLVVTIVRGIFNFTNAYWAETASQSLAYDLRNQLFTKLENLSFSYHDSHNTGQLMTRATSDVEGVRTFYATGILQLVSAIITFVGSIAILFFTDWVLALATMVVLPLITVVFVMIFSRMGPLFGNVQKNLGLLNNILQENIEGVRVVKGFTAEERELGRYNGQNSILYALNLNIVNIFSLGFPTIFFFANVATLIVIWFGGNRVMADQLSLGTLIAFNSYLAYLIQPIFQMGMISQQLAKAQASGGRIFEVLDAEAEISNVDKPIVAAERFKGQVTFEDVHFHYPEMAAGTLYDISLDVKPGGTVALLGPTGSGKSSILNLISRFYDVTEGAVRIDGTDVRNYELDSLRHNIGVVLQDVNLAAGTIRDNICYGEPGASQYMVEIVADLAQAHEFITQMPDGYETVLGEGGSGLSGGQRQRIAIARALLVRPSILIFDDSMSAVDAETEQKLREALAPVLARVTAFIIAQRISTVRNADLILIIQEGRIAARGSHEELMESSPLYADIVHSQLSDG